MPIFQVRTPLSPPPAMRRASSYGSSTVKDNGDTDTHTTQSECSSQQIVQEAVAAVESDGSCSPSRSFLKSPPPPSTPRGSILLSPCMRTGSISHSLQGGHHLASHLNHQHHHHPHHEDENLDFSDEQLLEFCAAIAPLVEAPSGEIGDCSHHVLGSPKLGHPLLSPNNKYFERAAQHAAKTAPRHSLDSIARARDIQRKREIATQTTPEPEEEEYEPFVPHPDDKQLVVSEHVAIGWVPDDGVSKPRQSQDHHITTAPPLPAGMTPRSIRNTTPSDELLQADLRGGKQAHGGKQSIASKSPRTDKEEETVASEDLVKDQALEPGQELESPELGFKSMTVLRTTLPSVEKLPGMGHGADMSAIRGREDNVIATWRQTASPIPTEAKKVLHPETPPYRKRSSSLCHGDGSPKRPCTEPTFRSRGSRSPIKAAQTNFDNLNDDQDEQHSSLHPMDTSEDKQQQQAKDKLESVSDSQKTKVDSSQVPLVESTTRQTHCMVAIPKAVKPGERFLVRWPEKIDGKNPVFSVVCPNSFSSESASSRPEGEQRYITIVAPGAPPPPLPELKPNPPSPMQLSRKRRSTRVLAKCGLMSHGKAWVDYKKSSSRVGKHHQALNLPACGAESENDSVEDEGCGVLWDPKLAETAKRKGEDIVGFVENEKYNNVDRMKLLEALHTSNYSVSKAKEVENSLDLEEQFTMEECEEFKSAIMRYGKNFSLIASSMLKSKSSCMAHYYRTYKRTKDYRELKKKLHQESKCCCVCDNGGELILCATCEGCYHQGCTSPPLKDVRTGDWVCSSCVNEANEANKSTSSSRLEQFAQGSSALKLMEGSL